MNEVDEIVLANILRTAYRLELLSYKDVYEYIDILQLRLFYRQ